MADPRSTEAPRGGARPALADRATRAADDPIVALLDDANATAQRAVRQDRTMHREAGRALTAWLDLLAAAAASGAPVALETTEGTRHHGVVALAGRDVVVLTQGDRLLLLAGAHVRSLHTHGAGALGDGRSVSDPQPVALRDLLARCAERRAPVVLRLTGGGEPVCGTLWSCGDVVCTVHTSDRTALARVHVPLGAIREAVIPRG